MSIEEVVHHDDGTGPYRHCPRCGGRLEERVVFRHDPPRRVCAECDFVFYLDPKVAVGTICRLDGGIVLLLQSMRRAAAVAEHAALGGIRNTTPETLWASRTETT